MSTSFCGIPSSISHSTVSNRLFEAAARSSPTSMLTSEPSGKYLINVIVPRPGRKAHVEPAAQCGGDIDRIACCLAAHIGQPFAFIHHSPSPLFFRYSSLAMYVTAKSAIWSRSLGNASLPAFWRRSMIHANKPKRMQPPSSP